MNGGTTLHTLLPEGRSPRELVSWRLHFQPDLLEALSDPGGPLAAYRIASRLCTKVPEQRYLNVQITRLSEALESEKS